MLLGKALDDVFMYKIGDRELTKMMLPELRRWEAELEKRVRNENRRAKGLPQRYIPILFGAAEDEKPALWLDLLAAAAALFLVVALLSLALFTKGALLWQF